jgi:hypothetical protein
MTHEVFRLRSNGKLFFVSDLSVEGMGIRLNEEADLISFSIGHTIEGELKLKGHSLFVSGQVRRVGRSRVGIHWENLEALTRQELIQFLDPKILGESLKLTPAPEGVDLWYHGHLGVDLWIWGVRDESHWERALMVLHGTYLEWQDDHLQGGTMNWSRELSEERGAVQLENLLLTPDAGALENTQLRVAKELLLCSKLPENLKKKLIEKLK